MKKLPLLALLLPSLAAAQATYTAVSCSQTDVQTAFTNEHATPVDGDIISIPACSPTIWSSGTTLTATFTTNVTIQGAGAVSATAGGASTTGSDLTTLTNHMGGHPMMQLTTTAGKSLRVTGIFFQEDASTGSEGTGNLVIGGHSASVRLDHLHVHIHIGGSKGIGFIDEVLGVGDHLYIETTQSVTNDFTFLNGGAWQGETDNNGIKSWSDADNFGTSKFFYIEDTRLSGGYASDCSNGGRWVFRYSTAVTSNNGFANHGTHDGSPVPVRGCRAAEVYQSTFNYTPGTGSVVEHNNSGPALVWGNTTTGYRYIVDMAIIRQNNGTYAEPTPPAGWGYCGNTQTGSTSVWDGNNTTNGYPCIDQPGRGQSDLLTQNASWPNIFNVTTGTQTWPHNALSPIYVWNNTYNDAGFSPEGCISDNSGILTENVDYYQQFATHCRAGSFNGTSGVGQGLLSARPATCTAGPGGNTPGVGYWATDTQTLYVCNPTNTWGTYYTPYTYPHPLQGAAAPIATFTPTSMNVGQVPVGMTGNSSATVTLQNTGTANLVATAITLGSSVFSLVNNSCGTPATITNLIPGTGFTLTPSQTCTFQVVYAPQFLVSNSDFAFFTDNTATTPDKFAISGQATGPPAPATNLFAKAK